MNQTMNQANVTDLKSYANHSMSYKKDMFRKKKLSCKACAVKRKKTLQTLGL